MRTIKNMD